MKTLLFGIGGTGLCCALLLAGTPGSDFDRVVAREPRVVYAAFSAIAREGTVSEGPTDGFPRRISRRVRKVSGQSINMDFLIDDRPVVEVEVNFAPVEGGTRITAEFDMDPYELGSAFETEAGVALSMVPQGYLDRQFANFMDDLADDVEAGRPLPPLSLTGSGVQPRRNPDADILHRRRQAERARRDASRPMMRATPMSDPSRVAREHARTGGQPLERSR